MGCASPNADAACSFGYRVSASNASNNEHDHDHLPQVRGGLGCFPDAFMRDQLARLGMAIWRGSLPFLLVYTGDGAATRAALLARGCVVRDGASFGMPEWVRVAPRRPDENAELVRAWASLTR